MTATPYIQLVPIQLKEGVDEKTLIEVSDNFQAAFVKGQKGILKRILLRGKHGGYADLVFFENEAAAQCAASAEHTSPEFLRLFEIVQMPDESLPDMGVLSFEHVKSYPS